MLLVKTFYRPTAETHNRNNDCIALSQDNTTVL